MTDNEDRWSELCSKYAQGNAKNHNDTFVIGRLAVHLRKAFAEACGCAESYVFHYRYEHGYIPEADTHEQVEDGWSSVTGTPIGWVFGFGNPVRNCAKCIS
jgi:hypothetical protein